MVSRSSSNYVCISTVSSKMSQVVQTDGFAREKTTLCGWSDRGQRGHDVVTRRKKSQSYILHILYTTRYITIVTTVVTMVEKSRPGPIHMLHKIGASVPELSQAVEVRVRVAVRVIGLGLGLIYRSSSVPQSFYLVNWAKSYCMHGLSRWRGRCAVARVDGEETTTGGYTVEAPSTVVAYSPSSQCCCMWSTEPSAHIPVVLFYNVPAQMIGDRVGGYRSPVK